MTTGEQKQMADRLRLDVVETIHYVEDGHPGPCMSIAEIITVLYFSEMNIHPEEPHGLYATGILSKGHACSIQYAAMAREGIFQP